MTSTSLSSVVLLTSGCVAEPPGPSELQLTLSGSQTMELRLETVLSPLDAGALFGTGIILAADPIIEFGTGLGANASPGTRWESVSFSVSSANSPLLFGTDAITLLSFR